MLVCSMYTVKWSQQGGILGKLNEKMYLNRRPTKAELHGIGNKYEEVGISSCGGCFDCIKHRWNCLPMKRRDIIKTERREKRQTFVKSGGAIGIYIYGVGFLGWLA